MYIAPDTNIRILHNVPIDTSYDHTIYFASKSAQTSYFSGLAKYTLNNYSYQRVKRGWMRVGIQAENLYDCNYLMFQNSAFGNKWFYAFIKSVEYINNVTSEIEFELDVMQTWFFDYTLDHCFVEREHSTTDAIGDNITPEPVKLGEQVFNNYDKVYDLSELAVIVGIVDTGEEASQGNRYDGIYSGATLTLFNGTDKDGINELLVQYIQKPDAVVCMYMLPKAIARSRDIPDGGMEVPSGSSGYTILQNLTAISTSDTLNGYKPKNNKLYTYPYNFIQIDNGSGNSNVFRYEFFDGLQPTLGMESCLTQPVTINLYPYHYKGSGNKYVMCEGLSVTGFPICSWNMDAYQAWIAQNTVGIGVKVARDAVATAMTGGLAAPLLINDAVNAFTSEYTASIQADMAKGNLNSGNVNSANGLNMFWYGRMSCNAENARIIDDFFTRFGYQTNKLKVPNRTARPHWNYVKTVGCTITGSVPSDDAKKITDIHNAGITYWKNGSEVGNYSLNNSL